MINIWNIENGKYKNICGKCCMEECEDGCFVYDGKIYNDGEEEYVECSSWCLCKEFDCDKCLHNKK